MNRKMWQWLALFLAIVIVALADVFSQTLWEPIKFVWFIASVLGIWCLLTKRCFRG